MRQCLICGVDGAGHRLAQAGLVEGWLCEKHKDDSVEGVWMSEVARR